MPDKKKGKCKRKVYRFWDKQNVFLTKQYNPVLYVKKKEYKMVENALCVQCCKCKHFYHDKCMPNFMQALLEEAQKAEAVEFVCHICI